MRIRLVFMEQLVTCDIGHSRAENIPIKACINPLTSNLLNLEIPTSSDNNSDLDVLPQKQKKKDDSLLGSLELWCLPGYYQV